jgi:hypothetical protein
MAMYFCNCGDQFTKRMELKQHIGLLNPHWPRKSDEDEHWEIDKAEYLNRQYRILKGE